VPAPPKYPSANEQFRRLAIAARERGLTFAQFWEEARRPGRGAVTVSDADPPPNCVLWPTDTADRRTSQAAIDETREAWRRAYERKPPLKREAAIGLLAPILDEIAWQREHDSEDEAPPPPRGISGEVAVA